MKFALEAHFLKPNLRQLKLLWLPSKRDPVPFQTQKLADLY